MTYQVDRNRWQTLSLAEQMGNIGSDVGRTFAALARGDKGSAEASMLRAVDLFDATAQSHIASFSKTKEILRAKEEFLACYFSGQDRGLEKYFTNFAVSART